ncbi:MAG: ATP-binding protein [Lachnospiraceae bacterium]|nr:ATP-binding protein [Lachnospiraceae bacterium]
MGKLRMPIGVDDFAEILTQGFYYVDKTGMIKELLENWGKVNLFTRPRRFGKSLNMSMLRYFFEIGTDRSLFDGLAITKETKLCGEYMGKYPVISISLKQVSGDSFEEARQQLWSSIAEAAEQLDYLQKSKRLNNRDKKKIFDLSEGKGNQQEALRLMSRMLNKHYGKKVMILIDEYDAPLQKAYENNYYDDMVTLIRQIFGYALKSNDSLFFSILTGCMRVSKESIFSDLNNPKIHSISDERFDEWFGFTEDETVRMLDYLGLDEHYEATKEWYDGYRFGEQDVYCPWDVINWCDQLLNTSDRIPQNFWVNSGATDIIRQFAEQADSVTRDQIGALIEGRTVRRKLAQDLTYRDMMDRPENIWSILYTAGYLTHRVRYEDGSCDLCIPNREVKNIFITKVDSWFTAKVLEDEDGLDEFFAAFTSGNAEALEDCLNYCLAESVSYLDGGKYEDKETFYHGLLLGMLSTRKGWEIRSEREAGNGRADITAFHLRRKEAYIIEVKYSRDTERLTADVQEGKLTMDAQKEELAVDAQEEKLAADAQNEKLTMDAQEAINQINRLRYDPYFSGRSPKSIRHYGIAFRRKQCRVLTE